MHSVMEIVVGVVPCTLVFAVCPDNCAKCDWEEDKTVCKPDRCVPEHVQVTDDPRKACVSE